MIGITIITVCCNAVRCIAETVDSVLAQTYSPIEYIIIDGKSTDGTLEVLRKYKNIGNISVYSEKDFGIYNAMNRGIARATGDYIYFLNAGDVLYDNLVIERVCSYIGDTREDIFYGKVCILQKDKVGLIEDYTREVAISKRISDGLMLCHQSIFAPKSAMVNHYFQEEYRICADYEWLLYSVCRKKKRCVGIPVLICNYDGSGVSSNRKNFHEIQFEKDKINQEYYKKENMDQKERNEEWKRLSAKHLELFLLMNQWLRFIQKGGKIENYLKNFNYKKVAIYGMSYVGETLWRELKNTDIEVTYAIDKNARNIKVSLPIYAVSEKLPVVDIIIVTSVTHFEAVKEYLRNQTDIPIMSMWDFFEE